MTTVTIVFIKRSLREQAWFVAASLRCRGRPPSSTSIVVLCRHLPSTSSLVALSIVVVGALVGCGEHSAPGGHGDRGGVVAVMLVVVSVVVVIAVLAAWGKGCKGLGGLGFKV